MKRLFSSITMVILVSTLGVLSSNVMAEAPELKTSAPFIHLADNLDEKDKLGWCIDTVGAGFSEKLHSHTCKPSRADASNPRGNDIKFIYNKATGQIVSHIFENKCMDLNDPENTKIPFGLVDCSSSESQKFVYDENKGQIQLASDSSKCVAVAPTSRSAGPFMSRDLTVENCEGTDELYTTWLIKEAP